MRGKLLVVSGPPCSGKTSVARVLAASLSLPLISKDVIKESLFDTLGSETRELSRVLGQASLLVLHRTLADVLTAGASCIAEGNFRPEQASRPFAQLLEQTGARAFQLQCVSDGSILVHRFTARSASQERHPGHADRGNLAELESELLRGKYEPLDLPGEVAWLDTTHWPILDSASPLVRQIATFFGCIPAG